MSNDSCVMSNEYFSHKSNNNNKINDLLVFSNNNKIKKKIHFNLEKKTKTKKKKINKKTK